jgi:hypothetical protein
MEKQKNATPELTRPAQALGREEAEEARGGRKSEGSQEPFFVVRKSGGEQEPYLVCRKSG